MIQKVHLPNAFAQFTDHWHPHIVGELNGQHVKVVKFQGEFVWHSHAEEDEMFLVLRGQFIEYGITRSGDHFAGFGLFDCVPWSGTSSGC